jgi:hypothetical protein
MGESKIQMQSRHPECITRRGLSSYHTILWIGVFGISAFMPLTVGSTGTKNNTVVFISLSNALSLSCVTQVHDSMSSQLTW